MFSRACQTFGQTSRCKVTNIAPTTTTNIIKALIQFVLLLLDIFYYLKGKQERIQNLCVESIRSDFYSSVVYVFLQSDFCFNALSFLSPPDIRYLCNKVNNFWVLLFSTFKLIRKLVNYQLVWKEKQHCMGVSSQMILMRQRVRKRALRYFIFFLKSNLISNS